MSGDDAGLPALNGVLSFFVKDQSAGIYVLNGPGKMGVDATFLR